MKSLKIFLFIIPVILFTIGSCSSDEEGNGQFNTGPDFSISEMAGSWVATEAVFIPESGNNPDDQVWIPRDGGSVTLVIQSSGRFTLTVTPPGRAPYTYTGEMFFEDGEFFAIAFDKYPGDYDYWGADLTANTLYLNSTFGEYDFDGDGAFENASALLTFARS